MERGVYSENQTQPELSLGMVLNLLRIKNKGFCLYNKHTPIKVCIVYIKKILPFYPVLLWKLRWSTYDTETKIVHINFERFNNQGYIPVFIICNISANGIGCFVCTSLNRGNQGCEDTFNNTGEFYRSDCQASRDGRIGMFPATQCIKMVAEDSKHINTRDVLAKKKSKINQYHSFGSYLETFVLVHVCMFFCPIHNKSLIGCETVLCSLKPQTCDEKKIIRNI